MTTWFLKQEQRSENSWDSRPPAPNSKISGKAMGLIIITVWYNTERDKRTSGEERGARNKTMLVTEGQFHLWYEDSCSHMEEKKWTRISASHIHKNQYQMDYELKWERHHFKTSKKKHRRMSLKFQSQVKFQLDSIKIKNFCSPKYTIKSKRQAINWKKIFTMHVINKGSMLPIYKC